MTVAASPAFPACDRASHMTHAFRVVLRTNSLREEFTNALRESYSRAISRFPGTPAYQARRRGCHLSREGSSAEKRSHDSELTAQPAHRGSVGRKDSYMHAMGVTIKKSSKSKRPKIKDIVERLDGRAGHGNDGAAIMPASESEHAGQRDDKDDTASVAAASNEDDGDKEDADETTPSAYSTTPSSATITARTSRQRAESASSAMVARPSADHRGSSAAEAKVVHRRSLALDFSCATLDVGLPSSASEASSQGAGSDVHSNDSTCSRGPPECPASMRRALSTPNMGSTVVGATHSSARIVRSAGANATIRRVSSNAVQVVCSIFHARPRCRLCSLAHRSLPLPPHTNTNTRAFNHA